MQYALLRVLSSCGAGDSVEGQPGLTCCPFHERISAVSRSLAQLYDMRCVPEFGPRFFAQCGACGFLVNPVGPADGAESCFACGARKASL